ncbi:hypothetical protein G3I42_07195, partial [Streptomyces sp. SID11385]|nr:hypothetical protein [Streptomyces sp. SID11385]
AATAAALPRFAPVASVREAAAPDGAAATEQLTKLLPAGERPSGSRHWQLGKDAGGRLLLAGGKGEVTVNLQRDFAYSDVAARTKDMEKDLAGKAAQRKPADQRPLTKEEARAQAEQTAPKKLVKPDKAALRRIYSCATLKSTTEDLRSCTTANLPDGSLVLRYETRTGSLITRTADVLRPDATRVVVTASNAKDTKHGPADLATPPLNLAALAKIAGNPAWNK